MARLIDANKLIDFIDVGHLRHPGELCYSEVDVANILLHAPTIDAVPIVRCEKCVLHRNCTTEDSFAFAGIKNPFCCVGKQKEGAD